MTNYVYLLQVREFIKTNEHIYKVGRTKKENLERFNQYPKGSVLLFQQICNNSIIIEKQIIKIFKEKFTQRRDIGNEYFEGEYRNMIDIIHSTIKNEIEPNNSCEYNTVKNKVSFICKVCKKSFTRKQSLERHLSISKVHDKYKESTKTYDCVCGNLYKHKQSLYNHKKKCEKAIKAAETKLRM